MQALEAGLAACRAEGADTSLFDFRAQPLPLFDQDMEAESGFPDSVKALKAAVAGADAILLASPEYNSSFTPMTKNLIDWVSRTTHGDSNQWQGKVAGIISASPGAFGGMRSVLAIRPVLVDVGCLVVSQTASVGRAFEAFLENGDLKDERTARMMAAMASSLVRTAGAMAASR